MQSQLQKERGDLCSQLTLMNLKGLSAVEQENVTFREPTVLRSESLYIHCK